MTRVVNLNDYRKRRNRRDAERQAEANRIAFGRTKEDKAHARRERDHRRADLDRKLLEDKSSPDDAPGSG